MRLLEQLSGHGFLQFKCFIIYKGYQGLIKTIDKANARRVNNIINKGGTILKSARSTDFRTSSGRKKHTII